MSEEVNKLIEQGQRALEKGDFKGATSKFNKVLKLDENNADAYFGKAEASVGLPKLSLVDVAGFYRRAIELAPENAFFLTSYGEFCLSHGLLPQAEQQYQKAAEVDPDNSHLYYSDLALGYFLNGLEFMDRQLELSEEDITRNALKYYLRAFGVEEEKAPGLFDRLEKEREDLCTPDEKKAEEQCAELADNGGPEFKELLKALEKEPNNPMTLLSLGQLSMERGSTDAGIMYFLKAAEMDEDNAPFFFNDLSTTLYIANAPDGGKVSGPGEEALLRTLSFALNALGYLDGRRAKELIKGGS